VREFINSFNRKKNNFSRKERLRKRKDLQKLFKGGSRYYSKRYTIIGVENGFDYSRFAVSVKKGIGNAVERNYEKRVCREFFRKEKQGSWRGYDLLVIVRDKTRNIHESYTMLKSIYSQLVHNSGHKTGDKR